MEARGTHSQLSINKPLFSFPIFCPSVITLSFSLITPSLSGLRTFRVVVPSSPILRNPIFALGCFFCRLAAASAALSYKYCQIQHGRYATISQYGQDQLHRSIYTHSEIRIKTCQHGTTLYLHCFLPLFQSNR